jgi:sortase A
VSGRVRWVEGGLLLVSFSALSLYGIVSLHSKAVQTQRGRELEELSRATKPLKPVLSEGALVGRVEVPRLSVSAVVLEGVSSETLRVAAGHVPGTAMPGEAGNAAIAAHRDSFFRPLEGIRDGDQIVVTTPAGKQTYHVVATEIVRPEETRVLDPTPEERLTLITCYPFTYVGSAPMRFIVTAARGE